MDYNNTSNIPTPPQRPEEPKNRTAIVVIAVLAIAFGAGYLVTMADKPVASTPATANGNTTASENTGSTQAAIAPAAGDTSSSSGTTTATTATGTSPTPPVSDTNTTSTAMPKTYTSEDECRSAINGACQAVSGGWSAVSQMNGTSSTSSPGMSTTDTPSDTSGD